MPCLAAVLANALPERHEHRIEAFDAVGGSSFGERGDAESADGAHLLLLVLEPVPDDLHQLLQVRQHRAAEQNRDLLHDLDACMTSRKRFSIINL